MRTIFLGTRFVVLELENNNNPYYAKEEYEIVINDILYRKNNTNVIGIYDLEPNQEYEIKASNESIKVKTRTEVICLHTDLFNPSKDGKTNDTIKLQAAILSCPDGGTVYIDKGTYLVTTLFLKSNVNIYLDKDAKLICEYDRLKFPVLPGLIQNDNNELNLGAFEGQEQDKFASIFTGIGIKNVSVAGQGEIDGMASLGDWYQNHNQVRIACRPSGVYLNRCENVTMAGFYIHDTACWNIHPYFSNNLNFLDLRVENPTWMPTTDGLDPDCCDEVLILGCRFSVGDDCIAIKSGTLDFAKKYLRACSNITIRNCYMAQGHGGVVLGSEASGGINNVTVSHSIFKDTDRGLRIKTRRGRGRYGKISNIIFDNITMDNVLTPFVVNMFYNMGSNPGHDEYFWTRKKQIVDETTPLIEDFTFENIDCKNISYAAGVFLGLPEEPIKSLTFKNVSFRYNLVAKPGYPVMIEHKKLMVRVGIYCENVDKLVLDNVIFEGNLGEKVVTDGNTNLKK